MPFRLSGHKINKLDGIIRSSSSAAIVVHTHPDGDALGSGIALRHWLEENRSVKARLIIPDTLPRTLDFLLEGEPYTDAGNDPEGAAGALRECDLLFVLDMNAFGRAEALQGALENCPAHEKVLIDHHLNPDEGAFTLVFSRTEISSTSELLYWILRKLEGGYKGLPQKSLQALMTGMTTDTNNFGNSVYPSTLRMASELLEAGVDRDYVLSRLYQDYSETRIRAFAALLGEGLTIHPGGVACIVATREFQEKYPLRQGETEGLVNIPLGIGAVNLSLFLKQEKDHFRVSIRSKRGWSANDMARRYFNGGGHEQAAGGKLFFPGDIDSPEHVYGYLATTAARFMQKDK